MEVSISISTKIFHLTRVPAAAAAEFRIEDDVIICFIIALQESYSPLMFAALMMGHHFSSNQGTRNDRNAVLQ
jgi:hypothetical protein